MGIAENTLCSLCEKEEESLKHLFFNCIFVEIFWESVYLFLTTADIKFVMPTVEDILFVYLILKTIS